MRQLVSDSISLWNNISTSKLKLIVGRDSAATTRTFPPVIFCDSAMTGPSGFGGSSAYADGTFAAGSVHLNTNPADATIVIHPEIEIRYLIAHELGHMLGLGYSEDTSAVMFYLVGGQTAMTPSQDDIAPPPGSFYILGFLLLIPIATAIRLRKLTQNF